MIHASQANATQPLQRGKHDDAHISKHEGTSYQRLHRAEWFLAAESEPPVGAHVVTQRRGYTHHGIYVGASQVVHYAGLARGLRRGPVEEISLSSFAARHAVGVIAGVPQKFDAREVVRRARSRLGENRYRLLTNNCEHFCEWCLQGERRSYQIEACLELPSRALRSAERLMSSLGECVSAFGKGVLNWGSRTFRVETSGFSRAHRALGYIERNLGPKMRLRDIADCVALSESHFSRALGRSPGSSPMAYVGARRVGRAKLMVASTRRKLTDIVLACGFSDQSHLTKSFRRVVGMSPGVWRRTSINSA
jgi:AraC-like DNA-binding protein